MPEILLWFTFSVTVTSQARRVHILACQWERGARADFLYLIHQRFNYMPCIGEACFMRQLFLGT